MMKLFQKSISIFMIVSFLGGMGSVFAADKGDFSTKPIANNGNKWRIGYYEGGEYINYQKTLMATVKGLMEMGWIEKAKIPAQKGVQTGELWKWLTLNAESEYVRFVKDAHYNANWDVATRKKMTAAIIQRLNTKNDIDLMIAMGTRPGQGLANDNHQTPTIVLSTSDPIGAGIIKSSADSGLDHVHARVDPLRYERQVRLFHQIIGFKKLGVAYDNNEAGRTYAAIDKVEKVADEAGFDIIRCHTRAEDETETISLPVQEERIKRCFREISETADAIYVTQHTGINDNTIPELVQIANSHRLPTFSQASSERVKYGFLMSISRTNFDYVGRYHAEIMAKIFNGAKPRDLDQIFEDPTSISINLKTAQIVGYDPPLDVMSIADEIYHEIEKPANK
jgi:ABC-type uncharacterized transport system substrate-binding protein